MSVVTLVSCKIVPIERLLGIPQERPSILARWWGLGFTTGDASGGSGTVNINLLGAASPTWQGHLLWNLEVVSVNTNGTIAPSFYTMRQQWKEAGQIVIKYATGGFGFATPEGMQNHLRNKEMVRFDGDSAAPAFVSMELDGNVITGGFTFYASGYLFDERML